MSEVANKDQAEFWNSASGRKWVTFQEEIDGMLAVLNRHLIDNARPLAGEAVLGVIGERDAIAALDLRSVPVQFEKLPALTDIDAALAENAPAVQPRYADNVLCRGHVASAVSAVSIPTPTSNVVSNNLQICSVLVSISNTIYVHGL